MARILSNLRSNVTFELFFKSVAFGVDGTLGFEEFLASAFALQRAEFLDLPLPPLVEVVRPAVEFENYLVEKRVLRSSISSRQALLSVSRRASRDRTAGECQSRRRVTGSVCGTAPGRG